MLSLDDDLWNALLGAYGIPYDPRAHLRRLFERPQESRALAELRERLASGGSVGTASYAAVPHLLDAGQAELALEIEIARFSPGNSPPPRWMLADYEAAWAEFLRRAESLTSSARESLARLAELRRDLRAERTTTELIERLLERTVR